MNDTARLPCTCSSEFQDKTYGKGIRLHIMKQKTKGRDPDYTCTVCGKVRST